MFTLSSGGSNGAAVQTGACATRATAGDDNRPPAGNGLAHNLSRVQSSDVRPIPGFDDIPDLAWNQVVENLALKDCKNLHDAAGDRENLEVLPTAIKQYEALRDRANVNPLTLAELGAILGDRHQPKVGISILDLPQRLQADWLSERMSDIGCSDHEDKDWPQAFDLYLDAVRTLPKDLQSQPLYHLILVLTYLPSEVTSSRFRELFAACPPGDPLLICLVGRMNFFHNVSTEDSFNLVFKSLDRDLWKGSTKSWEELLGGLGRHVWSISADTQWPAFERILSLSSSPKVILGLLNGMDYRFVRGGHLDRAYYKLMDIVTRDCLRYEYQTRREVLCEFARAIPALSRDRWFWALDKVVCLAEPYRDDDTVKSLLDEMKYFPASMRRFALDRLGSKQVLVPKDQPR
jgi:hypothetical protein